MTDSPSSRLLLRLQQAGGNTNVWGDLLDAALQLVDDAVAGMATIALAGNYTLARANFVTDEARMAVLKLTGSAPWTVTLPSITKSYIVWNTSTAIQTLTTGSGLTAYVEPGEIVAIVSNGVDVQRIQPTDFGGKQITGVADPTSPQDAATMAYVTAQIMGAFSGTFPGQSGANGWALFSNSVTPLWKQIASTDLSDFNAAADGRAAAMAIALGRAR